MKQSRKLCFEISERNLKWSLFRFLNYYKVEETRGRKWVYRQLWKTFLVFWKMFTVLKGSQRFFLKNSENRCRSCKAPGCKKPLLKKKKNNTLKSWAAGSIQFLWSGVLWFKSFLVMQSKDGNIKTADVEWWHSVISYRS